MDLDVDLHGFKELDKALDKLAPNIQKRVMQGAVTSAVREARKQIKAAAPKGEDQSKNSLQYGRITQNLKVKRLKRVKPYERAARVDTGNSFWALFYELGSKHQAARPFMAPAFRRSIPAMMSKLSERLKKGIEKEAAKLKK